MRFSAAAFSSPRPEARPSVPGAIGGPTCRPSPALAETAFRASDTIRLTAKSENTRPAPEAPRGARATRPADLPPAKTGWPTGARRRG